MRVLLFIAAAFAFGCSSPGHVAQTTPAAPAASATAPAPAAKAAPAAPVAAANDAFTCQRGKEERLLSIEKVEPKGCKLHYPQATAEVASSSIGPKHCEQVRDRIKENLETAGFKCAASVPVASSGPTPASAPAGKK